MNDPAIEKIRKRLKRLEDAVFGGSAQVKPKPRLSDYSGATGGVRFLIQKGYFNNRLGLGDVRAGLAEHKYHYSAQAVHEAVNRLAGVNGPLVALKEGGKKLYVKRK